MSKLLFLVAEDSYFCSHRLDLAKAALEKGFQVAVATRCKNHQAIIEQAGVQVFPLRYFNRSGINPIKQLLALRELYQIYQHYQPDVVHHVAVKPVLLGSVIAQMTKIPKVINALGGLGYLFTHTFFDCNKRCIKKLKKTLLRAIVCTFYQWAFSRTNALLLLQNADDKQMLIEYNCVKDNRVMIIPGSGIDITAYPVTPFPPSPPIIITCISRMLWDKGIGELVAAAELLQQQNLPIKLRLYGLPDPENPASIPIKTLEQWKASGLIEWSGFCNDVATAYAECHIAVLPSYREGLPKSLLEAASCGRPIVTTDVPGCREVVQEGENGFLVPVQNATELSLKLTLLIENATLREQMGKCGRQRVELHFSSQVIHKKILSLYSQSI